MRLASVLCSALLLLGGMAGLSPARSALHGMAGLMVHDADLGWVHTPGWAGEHEAEAGRWTVRTDAVGRRLHPATAPDAAPVVLVGDSFGFGWMLPEMATPAAALEREMRRPVLNLAVMGYGPRQVLGALERYRGPTPSAVVYMACSNDVDPLATGPVLCARVVEGCLAATRPPLGLAWTPESLAEAGWCLRRMAAWCAGRGVPLVVASAPFAREAEAGQLGPGPATLLALAAGAGATVIDTTPALDAECCYLPRDGHWSTRGAAAAARTIAPAINSSR